MRGIGSKKAELIIKVLNSEYEAIDTERNLEDAIVDSQKLLFKKPVTLIGRQFSIITGEKERQIVDLIYLDSKGNELIFVELKRGKLTKTCEDQLVRYLESAHQSIVLSQHLKKVRKIVGLLVSIEASNYKPRHPSVKVKIVDQKEVIKVLKALRKKNFKKGASKNENLKTK